MTRTYRYTLYVAIALVVVAVGFAGFFGFKWWQASGVNADKTHARDEVTAVAGAGIGTLTSLDATRVDQVYQDYLNVTTGAVHDDYLKNQDSFKQRIRDSKVVTRSQVREVAAMDVNLDQKQATVLAVVDTFVTEPGKAEVKKPPLRLQAALDQTDDGWKIKGLQQVPYANTGQ